MRRKTLHNAKLVITIESDKKCGKIYTKSVFDNRTKEFWSLEKIASRGIVWFLDISDMRETLNWNLNGDNSLYQFTWGQTANGITEGRAYIYD